MVHKGEGSPRKSMSVFPVFGLNSESKYRVNTVNLRIQFKCGALRDLVPFVQFKKHEKHP